MPTKYLDEGMRRWIIATARKNYWRVSAWYDMDDLIQEGYLCYQKCATKYARLVRKRNPQKEDRRNFMALVQVSFENRINDLASKRTRQKPEKILSNLYRANRDYNELDLFERIGGTVETLPDDEECGLTRLPTWMRRVFQRILKDVQAGKDITLEEINERLCREFYKYDEPGKKGKKSVDKLSEVYDYLGIARPNKLKRSKFNRTAMARIGVR